MARLAEHQKITILLSEYNTLRAEVLTARTAVAQVIGLGIPVFTTLLGLGIYYNSRVWWIILLTILGVAWYVYYTLTWNEMNTRSYTARLRNIEQKINKLADEPIMIWETMHGWGSVFHPWLRNFVPPSISDQRDTHRGYFTIGAWRR